MFLNLVLLFFTTGTKILRFVFSGESVGRFYFIFSPTAGIRQGGILSPYLFTVYVDDMLKKLNKLGCKFHGYVIGAIMYADDLVLISNSN